MKADVLPELAALHKQLDSLTPDPSALDVLFEWWVQRRKQLAMPLIRGLRPAPDPEDPDTTGVAFRPREEEGVRRMRSNNKKTYNLMASLHDEFSRLTQLCELIKRRERLKLDHHQASGEYREVAHRHLLHRLHRQRTGQGGWKDDLDEERPIISHKKGAARGRLLQGWERWEGGADSRAETARTRSGTAGRQPEEGGVPGLAPQPSGQRDHSRDRDPNRAASHRPPPSVKARPAMSLESIWRLLMAVSRPAPYEEIDWKAYNVMSFTVDTQRREELIPASSTAFATRRSKGGRRGSRCAVCGGEVCNAGAAAAIMVIGWNELGGAAAAAAATSSGATGAQRRPARAPRRRIRCCTAATLAARPSRGASRLQMTTMTASRRRAAACACRPPARQAHGGGVIRRGVRIWPRRPIVLDEQRWQWGAATWFGPASAAAVSVFSGSGGSNIFSLARGPMAPAPPASRTTPPRRIAARPLAFG